LLLAGICLFHVLVVFNNVTDFNTNYQFVRHVLSMDTILPGSPAMYRALNHPVLYLAFYALIIAWETASAVLLGWGVLRLARGLRLPASKFNSEKRIAMIGLALSLMMWLVAFIDVGGEWFLMWQSRTWNGQEEAFRSFVIVGIVFLTLLMPETDLEP
jgi:Predicted small integral membrane protein